MKRCPECNFLYLDSDDVCDLDGTRLLYANDTEVDSSPPPAAATQEVSNAPNVEPSSVPPTPSIPVETPHVSNSRNKPIFIVGAGLFLGLLVLLSVGYIALSRRKTPPPQVQQPIAEVFATSPAAPSPSQATPSPTPAASPLPGERPVASPSPRVTRATVSNNPVSTGARLNGPQGSVVIRLADGSKIEADEVWRTKEGVWYRRSGMVTLLSNGRVKAIEKTARK